MNTQAKDLPLIPAIHWEEVKCLKKGASFLPFVFVVFLYFAEWPGCLYIDMPFRQC